VSFDSHLQLTFSNASLSSSASVNVAQPVQLTQLGDLLRAIPPTSSRNVMRWTAPPSFTSDLSDELATEHFRCCAQQHIARGCGDDLQH
jgi:hypothetical protein